MTLVVCCDDQSQPENSQADDFHPITLEHCTNISKQRVSFLSRSASFYYNLGYEHMM